MDIIKKAELSQKQEIKAIKQIGQEEEEQKSTSEILMEYITNEGGHLFYDQFQTPCFTMPNCNFMAYKLDSNATRRYLSFRYWRETNKTINKEVICSVISTLEARAIHSGIQEEVYNRVAINEETVYIDIGDNKHVIKIDNGGWSIETDAPIYFRRFSHQKIQVLPERGGNFKDLLNYFNLRDELHQILILCYIPVCLIPNIPRALIAVSGDQGSGKSLFLKFIRELIDPSAVPIIAPPDSLRELVQFASHHYVTYLDNLSGLSGWLSDGLCRLVTGDGFSKRQLYTDDEDILYSYKRVVGMCGINQVATKADLLDRSIIIPLERISDRDRKEEHALWQLFETQKPKLFGALLDVLSATLKIAPELKLNSAPRMADYYRYASAAGIFLGYRQEQINNAFSLNNKYQNQEAIEASAVAQVIISFMESLETNEWRGSSSNLYAALSPIVDNMNLKQGFPKDVRWLWKKIKEVRPNLMDYGIQAFRGEVSQNSVIHLSKGSNLNGNNGNSGNSDEIVDDNFINQLFSEDTPP